MGDCCLQWHRSHAYNAVTHAVYCRCTSCRKNRRWSEAAPHCCMVWSAATYHRRGNRPVAWTAARLCVNWWATPWATLWTLTTRAVLCAFHVLLLTLLDSYLMWQLDFVSDAVLSAVKSLLVFTATCFSNVAVMGSLDVRLSVCLSVTLVSSDHIHWGRWNFITRLISPMSSLAARKISAI